QLEVELRSGPRIAVGQVEAADQQAVHRGLEIAAVAVVGIVPRQPGEPAPGLVNLADPAEDRHPVPTRLAMPDRFVAEVADRSLGELLVGRLELLQADDLGPAQLEPAQQHRQPSVDAVDVVGGDFHPPSKRLPPRVGSASWKPRANPHLTARKDRDNGWRLDARRRGAGSDRRYGEGRGFDRTCGYSDR